MRDPDGNEWEVFVVLEDNLAETAVENVAASCCVNNNANELKTIEGCCA